MQEVSQLATSLGTCNERISAKARSIMTRVCKICSVECPPLVTLQQAKASLGSQLEAMKVHSDQGVLLQNSQLTHNVVLLGLAHLDWHKQ